VTTDTQQPLVSLNLRILAPADASIQAISSAALYGKGVFTTIAIHDGKPFLWEKHWRRLLENAAKLGIDLAEFSEEATRKALDEIIEKNGVEKGRARLTFFDETAGEIWHFESQRKSSLLITTADQRPVRENFRVKMSLHRVSSLSKLAAIKSCNYLENILAYEEARQSGFDEAIRVNEGGEVVNACMANVFWLLNGRLFTPQLSTGCLPGTTREFILENLDCAEVDYLYDQVHLAEAIFLSSAGLGLVRVSELNGKKLPAMDHAILHLLPNS